MTGDTCDLLCLDHPRAEAPRRSRPDPKHLVASAHAAKAFRAPLVWASLPLQLRPGRYGLVCNIAGHFRAGMYTERDVG